MTTMTTTTDPGGLADPDLVAAYVGGDEAAFRELVARHHRRVHGVCHRYFRDRRDAEDATQETFLVLARCAAQFRGDAALSTWLHRVALNVCHDIARRRARRPLPARQEAPDVPEPLDEVGLRETELDLHRALARLDVPARQALVLVAVEGRTYAEAAAITGVSVAAMKSRIHRARARLTDILEVAA